MSLKPKNLAAHLLPAEEIRMGERIADAVEPLIHAFAAKMWGNAYTLERFTEVAWNVHAKSSLFKPAATELLLVHVGVETAPPGNFEVTNRLFLRVDASEAFKTVPGRSYPEIDAEITAFKTALTAATGLSC